MYMYIVFFFFSFFFLFKSNTFFSGCWIPLCMLGLKARDHNNINQQDVLCFGSVKKLREAALNVVLVEEGYLHTDTVAVHSLLVSVSIDCCCPKLALLLCAVRNLHFCYVLFLVLHACTRACMHACTYIIHTHAHTHTRTHARTHAHTHTHTHTHTGMHDCMHARTHTQ